MPNNLSSTSGLNVFQAREIIRKKKTHNDKIHYDENGG
jgi:hypothetical protein